MIRILEVAQAADLLARRTHSLAAAEAVVRPIIVDVERRGDEALREYARRFDGFEGATFRASQEELEAAARNVAPEFRNALGVAADRIRAFAERQLPREHWDETASGIRIGQIVRPLDRIAAYVPAGRYPLPSTLLMTGIPALVAGVPEICVTCPRAVTGIDAAAHHLGLSRVYRLGGAHAIAAFAFGTETIPKVDRIVGPGSAYVAAAKKLLAGVTGIDFVAGPTEIVIIADQTDPRLLAADMLAQAEHDVAASAILLTTSRALASAVSAEIERQLNDLPAADVARAAIHANSAIVLVSSQQEALAFSNRFAPEHLSVEDASLIAAVTNAGSVFVGPWSPEAAGDYASGPNHVLPTDGFSRIRGGLSSADFVKVISVQQLTAQGLQTIAPAIAKLARAEGLEAHARSVELRSALSPDAAPMPGPKPKPRPAVLRMAPYSPPTAGRHGKLRLDFNENTVGCSPRVLELLRTRFDREQAAVYPEYTEVKPKLAAHLGLSSDEILLTNGTDEAIQVFVNTFVDDAEEVVLIRPSYAMYRFYAELAGATIRSVDYAQPGMRFPYDQLREALTSRTRAVILGNPNNPTGVSIGLEAIENILQAAPHAAVFLDEAYFEFCGISGLGLVRQYPNLFVTRTFSKAYGMAALRLGVLVAQPGQIAHLHKAQSPYSVNMLAATAACAAVDDCDYVARYVAEVLKSRAAMQAALQRLEIPFTPSSANFVLFDAGERKSAMLQAFLSEKILVRDRSHEFPGALRITIGTAEQNERAIRILERLR